MTDSTPDSVTPPALDTHPEVADLAAKIVADFKKGGPRSDNYREERLQLISKVGDTGLASVDEELAQVLRAREEPNDQLRQRLIGWSSVLLHHTQEAQR